MQVITTEFKEAVLKQLNSLQAGFYLTRDQLCVGAGVDNRYANIVSILMQGEEFAGFECVKSRGVRRKSDLGKPTALSAQIEKELQPIVNQ